MSKSQSNAIAGWIKPGFEAVRAAFVENFIHGILNRRGAIDAKRLHSLVVPWSTLAPIFATALYTSQKPINKNMRPIIACFAGSCALMMTGFGIAKPVFARRLSEIGAGVEVLSLMAMAAALAQFLLARWMGALADRFGRSARPDCGRRSWRFWQGGADV